jgi:hypothetical protein
MNTSPLEDKPISSIFLMTEQQKAQAFLDEYKTLRDKYGFDFVAGIQLIKINVDNSSANSDTQPVPDSVAVQEVNKKPADGNKK